VLIPPAVLAELRHPHAPAEVSEWLENLPHWASIQAPVAVETGMGLDAGESEAISLALEMSLPAILIDERDGWIEAQRRGLTPIGTLNVLYTAHGLGLLDFENAIGRLRRTNFHVNSALVESLIEKVRTRKRE
jgi:predicted nucleic acid-binding protein